MSSRSAAHVTQEGPASPISASRMRQIRNSSTSVLPLARSAIAMTKAPRTMTRIGSAEKAASSPKRRPRETAAGRPTSVRSSPTSDSRSEEEWRPSLSRKERACRGKGPSRAATTTRRRNSRAAPMPSSELKPHSDGSGAPELPGAGKSSNLARPSGVIQTSESPAEAGRDLSFKPAANSSARSRSQYRA